MVGGYIFKLKSDFVDFKNLSVWSAGFSHQFTGKFFSKLSYIGHRGGVWMSTATVMSPATPLFCSGTFTSIQHLEEWRVTAESEVKCPDCGSQRAWKDGISIYMFRRSAAISVPRLWLQVFVVKQHNALPNSPFLPSETCNP